MINNFIIWGAKGHAKVLSDLLSLKEQTIIAIFDNDTTRSNPLSNTTIHYGYDGFAKWINAWQESDLPLPHGAIAIGGTRGADRLEIARLLWSHKIETPVLTHPTAIISNRSAIGDGSQILAGAFIGTDVTIKECVIVNSNASVDHDCQIGSGTHIAPASTLCGNILIGDRVLIGPGSTIVPDIEIGNNTIIGAGSVVTRSLPANVFAWGSPAKIIKENN